MAENKVSIRPSEFVEGGAVPVDKELLWKECRFANFDYTKKDGTVAASTIAARITYVDNDGTEYVQHYSAGDPARFQPSKDQKTLVAVGTAQALAKSSNYYILMNALINAGFPENKIDADISILDGMKTFNIGIPEPKRVGLKTAVLPEGTVARERILSVPSKIIQLPWDNKKAAKGAVGAKKEAGDPTEADESAIADAIAAVTEILADAESATRQQVATKLVKAKKSDAAQIVFKKPFSNALIGAGFTLEGDTITKIE